MSIVKNTVTYSISTFVAQAIGIFTSLATRKYLTPEMMGIWAFMLLILNYLSFGHCGIFTAVEVHVPYLRGRGEKIEIGHIRDIAFTVSVGLSILVFLFLLIVLLFFPKDNSLFAGLKWVAFIGIATIFYNLYLSFLRADKNFFLISVVTFVNALALFVLTLLFGPSGLTGIYRATFFATIVSFLFLVISSKYKLVFSFNFARTKKLFLIGFPILIFGFIYTLFISLDKIFIIKWLGSRELGFYSIAILAFTYANTIPKLFSIVILPNMQEKFGRSGEEGSLTGFLRKPYLIMSYIFPPALALIYYCLPVVVVYFLPKYVPGIVSMQILLIGCFFISLAYLPQNIFISLNKQFWLMLWAIIASAIILIGGYYLAIMRGIGIKGLAISSSLGYLVYFILCYCHSWKISRSEFNLELFFKICLPFIVSVFLILLIDKFIPVPSNPFSPVIKLLIYFFLYFLLVFHHIDKNEKIIPYLFSQLKRNTCPSSVSPGASEAINEA